MAVKRGGVFNARGRRLVCGWHGDRRPKPPPPETLWLKSKSQTDSGPSLGTPGVCLGGGTLGDREGPGWKLDHRTRSPPSGPVSSSAEQKELQMVCPGSLILPTSGWILHVHVSSGALSSWLGWSCCLVRSRGNTSDDERVDFTAAPADLLSRARWALPDVSLF